MSSHSPSLGLGSAREWKDISSRKTEKTESHKYVIRFNRTMGSEHRPEPDPVPDPKGPPGSVRFFLAFVVQGVPGTMVLF